MDFERKISETLIVDCGWLQCWGYSTAPTYADKKADSEWVVNLKMILELADDECNSDRRAVFNSCDRLVL